MFVVDEVKWEVEERVQEQRILYGKIMADSAKAVRLHTGFVQRQVEVCHRYLSETALGNIWM